MTSNFSWGLKLLVVTVLALAFAFSLPNVLSPAQRAMLPSFMPNQAMPLGLDLQGGAHLVLEVDMADVERQAYENLTDNVRLTAREKRIGYASLRTVEATETTPMALELVLRDASDASVLREALTPGGVIVENGAGGEVRLSYNSGEMTKMRAHALAQTLQVLRSRVDEFGVAEPVVQQQGDRRVIVELPGIRDVARAKAAIGRTARLTFHLVDENANPAGPIGAHLQVLPEDIGGGGTRPLVMQKRPALSGDMLTSAGASFDQYGAPAVSIAFDPRGTRIFAKISTDNVNKRFAIVLDGKVYSAPVFREPILGGNAQISGNFTTEEAQDLSAILSAGALPAKVNVVEERTIGPSLGSDSVQAGVLALVIGFILVLIFMLLFYGIFGLLANVALFVNLVILVGVMSAVGFTLSLPGMAGIVLTLGMAVDANVLIYERMREEMAAGKKPLAALIGGFQGAYGTILDSNVTTLVAAVVLFALGSGPVKGFAVSLSIGLIASMFTAITLSRWMCLTWLKTTRAKQLPL